ncbi:MAG: Asp23/Gls24 family envelope stress response protein [Ruminococcus sp.]|jgi:uncharacterized alkaline shock family protein YloU|nr:Asp23/Gls24 family envelope stress response protein [Ruminococcus sp.]
MIIRENYMGKIGFSESYIKSLCGMVLCECVGVSGLLPAKLRIGRWFWGQTGTVRADRAVAVKVIDGRLIIGVHIAVVYGSTISAVSESIVGKLKWAIEERTGVPVQKITVYVDAMTA